MNSFHLCAPLARHKFCLHSPASPSWEYI